MFSRGFRHSHQAIYPPVFLRLAPRKQDLLPWVDPYITSLFHPNENLVDELLAEEMPSEDEQDELDPRSRR